GVGVVDRRRKPRGGGGKTRRVFGLMDSHAEVGKNGCVDAQCLFIATRGWPMGLRDDGPLRLEKLRAVRGGGSPGPLVLVQEGRVERVHAVLDGLDPVAVGEPLKGDPPPTIRDQEMEPRHEWRRMRLHVDENYYY